MGGTEALLAISAMSTAMGVQQAHSQSKAANKAAQAQVNAQARQLRESQAIEERRERERLKQNLATQRARFGAAGVSGAGGSSAALLKGLFDRTERDLDDTRRLNLMRTEDLYTNLAHTKRRNLLDASGKIGQSVLGLAEAGVRSY